MSQCSVVFPNRVFVVFLKSCNFPRKGVQPIVFRIECWGTYEKRLRTINRPESNFGLCRRKLQTQIARHGIGGLSVEFRGLILFAVELVGIGEFSDYVGLRAVE